MTMGRGYKARVLRQIPVAANVEELIPGIPNDISVARIATKLPWKSIILLSSVSRAWYHAVRSRQVYDARVRTHSTDRFQVAPNLPVGNTLQLTALRFELPPITCEQYFDAHVIGPRGPSITCDGEIEPWGRIATLDGKVYVLGRLDCTVHVLDLAGQREWKQCASMRKPIGEFARAVIEGKIYVFERPHILEGDLYNHEEGTWSTIRTVGSLRRSGHVGRLTSELAEPFDTLEIKFMKQPFNFFDGCSYPLETPETPPNAEEENHMEVYDPTKDEWKDVEPAGVPRERLFEARGKFYSLTPVGVHVYDFHGNSWIHLHSFSFAIAAPVDSVEVWPLGILLFNNELLALVEWPGVAGGKNRACMFQSSGFGSKNKELVWHKALYAVRHWSWNESLVPDFDNPIHL